MRLIYKKTITLLLVFFTTLSLFAQNNFFSKAVESSVSVGSAQRVTRPERFNLVEAATQDLKTFLWSLPLENAVFNGTAAPVMTLPMPNGTVARFRVWQSSIQEPGLEAKFPEIKTFAGQGIDDPYATIRMDYNPYFGFHAQILSVSGRIYVDPYARGNIQYYQSYYHADNKRLSPFYCGTNDEAVELPGQVASKMLAGPCRGTQLYTYRLAVACTGEYANAVGAGGTNAALLHSAIVTTVNRVSGVYENDLAIRFLLVANNNIIEYLVPSTDPFSGNFNGGVLLGESQTVITNNIGSANFDIGHTFSTGGGGIAGLGVVCSNSVKARGITGSGQPFGDGYDIDYVAHEMGHQFGATHTFNSNGSGSCTGGTRTASTAYEVGSGTSIMAYAGICGFDNIQPNSDPYFHPASFDQISNFVESGGFCHGTIATGNTIPVINSMDHNNVTIPINTPFTLTGSATDADGDPITYDWEQWDLGTGGAWNTGASSSSAPLFKSRVPKTTGSRTFPDLAVILAGYPSNPSGTMGGMKGETLPLVTRTMKFKLVVRDNRAGGGGVTSGGDGCQIPSIYQINVAGSSPFTVTTPNGGEAYTGGSTQTIVWDKAATDQAPFSVANVKISLSTDGGFTYPTVILASTPNDGSEIVTMPLVNTTTARIKIEAISNVFFDISNANFSITGAVSSFDFGVPTAGTVVCGGAASVTAVLPTTSSLGFVTPINLSASNVPAGTSVSFSPNPVVPGSSSNVTLNAVNTLPAGTYNIIVTGVAGAITKTIPVSFVVQPGAGPAITNHPANATICESGNVSFTVVSPTATAYQWQLSTDGGANFLTLIGETNATLTLLNVSASQNGYQYRVIVAGPCNASVSNAATLTVSPRPNITIAANPTSILPGMTTTITSTPTLPASFTYLWTFNNTPIAGATGPTYTAGVTGIGNYILFVRDTITGCNNQSNALSITATPSTNLFIFPIPNNGMFNIAYYHAGANTSRYVTVYDSRGALVYERTHTINAAYQLLKVNMISAAAGTYLVVISDKEGKKIATGKVLVGNH